MARILLLDPFMTGSHQQWAEGWQTHSRHDLHILGLRGKHWKWRMRGGAISLARKAEALDYKPDLVVATDMLDVAAFTGLMRKDWGSVPLAMYFHENQLTYPHQGEGSLPKRDLHLAFTNYTSALSADYLIFNSRFHQHNFFEALPPFLKIYPDHRELDLVEGLGQKARVWPVGLTLPDRESFPQKPTNTVPVVLWNHRWEHDKGPEAFFELLFSLADEGLSFQLIVLGEAYARQPAIFSEAKTRLSDRILHWGYAADKAAYWQWLSQADVLPVTSQHDFFGISVVEAIYAGCYPILPRELVYQEHVPAALWQEHSYQDGEDLGQKLKSYLQQPATASALLAAQVQGYDWRRLVARYDAEAEEMLR
ncbi:MAG: DUF3524 domain-containing protein [Bacteroidota bacterium]